MIRMVKNKKKMLRALLFFLALFAASFVFAAMQQHDPQNHQSNNRQHHDEEWHEEADASEYNAGENILEHIIDSHEWHIATIGETHISIPLPVILWSEGKLYVFMSSKFHHGHASYKGFHLETQGEYKGKIVRDRQLDMLNEEIVEIEQTAQGREVDVPLDFSITKNVLAIWISMIILCWVFISVARRYKDRKGEAPKGLQSMLEPLILFIRDDVAKAAIGEKKFQKYLPFLLTLFFFIFLNNLLGLVPIFPGGANVTGNIAVTGVLAVFSLVVTTFTANKDYWKHIFNTPGVPVWLKLPIPLMPIVELVGIFTKPFVLMVRLFANITAGHIILLGFVSLIFIFGNINTGLGYGVSVVSVLFAIFIGLLELLVAFIQAYVFTLLSALYFGMALEEHHH